MRSVFAAVLLSALAAMAQSNNTKLLEARALFDDLELEKAAKALATAEATPGNARQTVLQILELQAIVYGTMNKEARARDACRALLLLEPGFVMPKDQPPRVRTPYLEAKEWAEANPLLLAPSTRGCEEAACTPVVQVTKDTLRLIKKVRFVLLEGPEPTTREVVPEGGSALVALAASRVQWRAELLGKADAVLLELGPFTAGLPAEKPVASPTTLETSVTTTTAAAASGPPWRPIGYAVAGGGVLAAGLGVLFGVLSSQARGRITGAMVDGAGLTTSITQRDAAESERVARSQATIANALFVTGGVLVAAGVVFFIVGAPASPESVSFSVGPSGLSVWGHF